MVYPLAPDEWGDPPQPINEKTSVAVEPPYLFDLSILVILPIMPWVFASELAASLVKNQSQR
ncbi:MAG: hypothetical protein AAF291_00380 [Pseudomonadota bacterium]